MVKVKLLQVPPPTVAQLSTAGRTPSKVLSSIIRLVDAARLHEGGSLAAPGVRLSELARDLASYLLMLNGRQSVMSFEALWRSTAGRMAVVHAFLSSMRVVCDPRANPPGTSGGTAASASGATKKGLYKSTSAGSTANSVPGGASAICASAAGVLCRLFLHVAGSQDSDVRIHNCPDVPAAAADMVEELLRGDCLPLLGRLLACGAWSAPVFAASAPNPVKVAAGSATMIITLLSSLLVVGMHQPHTRSLIFSPKLPACRLMELWAHAAANEAPGPPRHQQQRQQQLLPSTEQETTVEYDLQLVLSQHKQGKFQSVAHAMRSTLGLLLEALLPHRSDGGEPLRAVLSGPCLQYLVALQAVSQLHAADGGTLYGLPPAAVLPPELAAAEVEGRGSGGGSRRQGLAVLNCSLLKDCVDFWNSCVTGEPRVSLGPLRNRGLVHLCMRLSRVALASLEVAEDGAAQPQTGKLSHSQQGQQQQQREQAGSDASGVAAVALQRPLAAGTCMSLALQSLHLAAAVLRGLEGHTQTHRGSSAGGRCSTGGNDGASTVPTFRSSMRGSISSTSTTSSGGGSICTSSTCSSTSTGDSSNSGMLAAPPSSTDGGCSSGVVVTDSQADSPAAAPQPPAEPRLCSRSFGRRWWPLAVEAVRAALRQPGAMERDDLFNTCCGLLRVSAKPNQVFPKRGTEERSLQVDKVESNGATEGNQLPGRVITLSTIPPGLVAALSAGLLPTLTDLARSSCGAASGSVDVIDLATTPMDPMKAAVQLSKAYCMAYGAELLLLLSHADPAQAAALLTALADAPLGLLPMAGMRMTEVQVSTAHVMIKNFSNAFAGLVSGLLPPEETKSAHCAWAWPRDGGGDSRNGSPALAPEAVAPAYRQMLQLASFVLHTWLPVLARMHEFAGELEPKLTLQLQQGVLLAARACRAAWRRGNVQAVGSWRQLLQRHVCAARWVGAEVVAGWEAEGWWSGAVEQQQDGRQQGGVAAGAGVKEQQQQGEEGQAGGVGAGSEWKAEEAWSYPLPLAPCESAALLRT